MQRYHATSALSLMLGQASAEHLQQCAQSRPWSARRDGIAHFVRPEGHRYRLRRRAIDSAPFSLLATGKACHSWSALRTDVLSEIAKKHGKAIDLAIGHVQDVDSGQSLEHFAGKMGR